MQLPAFGLGELSAASHNCWPPGEREGGETVRGEGLKGKFAGAAEHRSSASPIGTSDLLIKILFVLRGFISGPETSFGTGQFHMYKQTQKLKVLGDCPLKVP